MKNLQNLKLKNSSIGKIGINISGDLEDEEIVDRAKIVEKSGVKIVWVGEFEGFKDPLDVAEIIANSTSLFIGFGVLSPLKRECSEIKKGIKRLQNKFGNRFLVGIGAGKFRNAKEALNKTVECIKELRYEFTVVAGCSSPKITHISSNLADGILFNYVHPRYLQWIKRYVQRKVFFAAYGPSLILPSGFEEDLLIASAIVFMSSKKFLREFRFENIAEDLSHEDLDELISLRRKGLSIKNVASRLIKYKKFLLENFTISGDFYNVANRIKLNLKICDHVILSDPFYRDMNSVNSLKKLVKLCEKF